MFFFFVGGLEQQAGQVLKRGVGRCINCGSNLNLVEYEKVLKLFFVPVWRWPGKEPLLHCPNCNIIYPQSFSLPPPPPPSSEVVPEVLRCHSCGRNIEAEYSFCPFCGVAL
uniref:Zinc-ribbon 15 domain-containing protein n=1 Tax=Opuntia streptacantha TaxID=393608 RepID=A0A7C8YMF6_OPUST